MIDWERMESQDQEDFDPFKKICHRMPYLWKQILKYEKWSGLPSLYLLTQTGL